MADTNQNTNQNGVGSAVSGIGNTANNLINKASGWVDQGFQFFGLYSTQYSKYIVYAVLLVAASKIFKFKFNINTGGGGRK